MSAEHQWPPSEPLEALAAAAQLGERHLRHIRSCPSCRVAWYQSGAFRAGCTEPRLGARLLTALGARNLDAALGEHLAECLACRVLVLSAQRATGAPVPPGPV